LLRIRGFLFFAFYRAHFGLLELQFWKFLERCLCLLGGWVGGFVLVVIFFFGLCGACPEEEEEEGKSGTVFRSWVGRNREETEEDFFQAEKEKGIAERSPKAMFSFASPLASQIGFLIASLNQSNYKSLALELNQVLISFSRAAAAAAYELGYQLLLFSTSEVQEEEGGVDEELHVAPDAAALAEMSKP
jgi:hypothetical protein